jgi:low affinity Fe/Cu permease
MGLYGSYLQVLRYLAAHYQYGTTIITFLMVFIIQNTQNRDGAALQAKLDELIRSSQAKNQFIGIEHLTAEEIEEYRKSCEALTKKVTERRATRGKRTK